MGKIGIGEIARLENVVADLFDLFGKDRPMRRGEAGYAVEGGTWVDEDIWDAFWEGRPTWEMHAYMVAGNGQKDFAEVADMTPEEVSAFYLSDEFEPETVYWTSGE